MRIYFDMDGTLANLYGVENWERRLRACDATPYEEARPCFDLCTMALQLKALQRRGVKIGVISWLSKDSTKEYDDMVRRSKLMWLRKHLPSIMWDEIHLVKYGTPKHFCCQDNSGILFDDNEDVRRLWDKRGRSFDVDDIVEVLKDVLIEVKRG